MKRILFFLMMSATFASAQTDSTDILITVREDGDTTTVGRWRAGMPVVIRDSWNEWGEREKQGNKFVIVRVGIAKARIDTFLAAHTDSTTRLRRKYQLSRAAIQFVKNNRDANNVVRVTPAQLRNAFKRANRLRRFGEPQRMSIIPDRLYIKWRNMLIGATQTSATVNTDGGGDYTTLAAAEAGEQKDLVTANELLTINCSGTTADGATVFNGWITDATRYVVNIGNNESGIWSTAHYRLEASSGHAITAEGLVVYFKNMQIKCSTGFGVTGIFGFTNSNVFVENCIVDGNAASVNQHGYYRSGGISYIAKNCIVYNANRGFWGVSYAYNCTAYNSTTYGFINVFVAKNCISQNAATADFSSITTSTYNLSSDATATGTGSLINKTVTFVNTVANDFSPSDNDVSGTKTGGIDLSAEGVTTDITGATRPLTGVSIGAFQYFAPSEESNTKKSRYNGFGRGFGGGWKK